MGKQILVLAEAITGQPQSRWPVLTVKEPWSNPGTDPVMHAAPSPSLVSRTAGLHCFTVASADADAAIVGLSVCPSQHLDPA
jgi:hypothetical protein